MEPLALVAPLTLVVVVPLGLALCDVSGIRRRLLWPAALLGASSFFLEQGWLAAALSGPWLLFTGWVAAEAVLGFWRRRGSLEEVAVQAAMVYLAIGGVWLVISRAGLRPLGFGDGMVLLSSMHFHHAGFAACVFTGMTGRALTARADSAWFRWPACAVVTGTPALAMGISLSRWIEIAAAFWLAAGVTVIAGLTLAMAFLAPLPRTAQLCFAFTAASTVVSMSLAGMYALSEFSGAYWVPTPQMATTHGVANAAGMGLAGLTGWLIVRPKPRPLPTAS